MTSCLVLEQPGRWRSVATTAIFVCATLPLIPLLWTVCLDQGSGVGAGFWLGVRNALSLAAADFAVSLSIGLPLGVLAALYQFPARSLFLALTALPVVVPSLLWAIGAAALTARLASSPDVLAPFAACVHVFALGTIPLVVFATSVVTRGLSRSQIDAARLAGGERAVVMQASRNAAAPAGLAALFGAVLTLADPSPGQIFGMHTAAASILTSFAARYDPALAGRQALLLTALALVLAAPALVATGRLADVILAQQVHPAERSRDRRLAALATLAFGAFLVVGMLGPLAGLLAPVVGDTALAAGSEGFLSRHPELVLMGLVGSAVNTVLYGVGAGAVGVALGVLLALSIGRQVALRVIACGALVMLCCWPPAAAAIGIAQFATSAPAWADPFLRSRFTVCVALGLRFFPIAALLALRLWGRSSPSWALAAAVHGVPPAIYLHRVVVPFLVPGVLVAFVLVALLAAADVTTVLILHPPGEASIPLAIFTVMANAPERVVATMCLAYLCAAAGILWMGWYVIDRQARGALPGN